MHDRSVYPPDERPAGDGQSLSLTTNLHLELTLMFTLTTHSTTLTDAPFRYYARPHRLPARRAARSTIGQSLFLITNLQLRLHICFHSLCMVLFLSCCCVCDLFLLLQPILLPTDAPFRYYARPHRLPARRAALDHGQSLSSTTATSVALVDSSGSRFVRSVTAAASLLNICLAIYRDRWTYTYIYIYIYINVYSYPNYSPQMLHFGIMHDRTVYPLDERPAGDGHIPSLVTNLTRTRALLFALTVHSTPHRCSVSVLCTIAPSTR